MDKYLEPTKDQIIMGFVASCIESVADRLNAYFLIKMYVYHNYSLIKM